MIVRDYVCMSLYIAFCENRSHSSLKCQQTWLKNNWEFYWEKNMQYECFQNLHQLMFRIPLPFFIVPTTAYASVWVTTSSSLYKDIWAKFLQIVDFNYLQNVLFSLHDWSLWYEWSNSWWFSKNNKLGYFWGVITALIFRLPENLHTHSVNKEI